MKIRDIKEALDASIIEGGDKLELTVEHIYASDLMSDVLAFGKSNSVLLTGLATQQAIISAHMAEFDAVVLIRGKKTKESAEKFARDYNLVLLSTELDMYDACIKINAVKNGVNSPSSPSVSSSKMDDILLDHEFAIEGNDFTDAGMTSTEIKSILKKIGLDPQLIRRVAISSYEGEMNVVMHAFRAKVYLTVTTREIKVVIDDEGKGIPDVTQALQKGYTTATEEMRAMGFGSGMGLPNIEKNSDKLDIKSEIGKGTKVEMTFFI